MSLPSVSPIADVPAPPMPARFAERVLSRMLSGIRAGGLSVVLPSGRTFDYQGALPGPQAVLKLLNWRPLLALFWRGDLGFGESYMAGDWESPDLTSVIEVAARNAQTLDRHLAGPVPARLLARLRHRFHGNTRWGARRNIAFHYDLGNEFYRHWLDERMVYSSALYRGPGDTLEQAQETKLARIVDLLGLEGHERVLEIGCGWGELAARLAGQGAQVTGLTLSREQLDHARSLVERLGLSGRVELRLQDYRDVPERYDRIVSIEMIEAVGEAYLPEYFRTLRRCLAPGGRVVLQAITIADAQFEVYRRRADFIQTHVFPGAMLPSPVLLRRLAGEARLRLVQSEAFGESYARTLADWRERFLRAWPEIARLGFSEEFRRLWTYYLSYCEAGFRAGSIDVGLWVFGAED